MATIPPPPAPPFLPAFPALLAALALGLTACSTAPPPGSETAPIGPQILSDAAQRAALSGPVSFRAHVAPILENRCLPCHNGASLIGILDLSSRRTALLPSPSGQPRIVPGDPARSLLFLNPQAAHHSVNAMPPVGNRLTDGDLAVLRRWIAQGAPWPHGPAGVLAPPAS